MSQNSSTNQKEAANIEKILDCDVIVAGAGVAGAAAAYYMSKAGMRVTVFEQQHLPLTASCGNLISPSAIRELQKIGVAEQAAFKNANVIDRATIYLSGKELADGVFPEVEDMPRYSRATPGKVLDGLVLEAATKAGARVFDQSRVANFVEEKNWVTVVVEQEGKIRTLRARLLVGADGANSTVSRILKGATWSPTERALVARAYLEGVSGSPNEANVYYSSDCFPGYSWLFPAGNGEANVGVGVALGATPEPENPEELLKKLIETDEGMKLRLKGAKLKSKIEVGTLNLFDPQAPLVSDRVVLIGLAAGLVNPYNGEGIQMGLLSAKWASETAKYCMKTGGFSRQTLNGYVKWVNYELGGGLKVSGLILSLVRNRKLNKVWLKWIEYMGEKCKTDAQYRRLISGVLSGMIFPDEEASVKALLGTLQEAALFGGATAFSQSQTSAQNSQATEDLKQTGNVAAEYAAQNPLAAFMWGVEALMKAAEIAGGVSKQVTNSDKKQDSQPQ